MNSQEIKAKSLPILLYGMGYHAAFTEMQGADIYAIRRSKYTHEFEVKISRSDLMSELNCVAELLKGELTKAYPKRFKHEKYLGKSESILPLKIPNFFSFIVPSTLVSIALKILKDTPYGVYEFKEGLEEKKKPELLHKEKIDDEMFFYLLRKASNEVVTLRSKINPQEVKYRMSFQEFKPKKGQRYPKKCGGEICKCLCHQLQVQIKCDMCKEV